VSLANAIQFGCAVAPASSIVTKLWYCDTTQQSDFVTEQERSLAISTRPRPHAIRKAYPVIPKRRSAARNRAARTPLPCREATVLHGSKYKANIDCWRCGQAQGFLRVKRLLAYLVLVLADL